MSFQYANTDATVPYMPLPDKFSIIAQPGTDIWSEPPSHIVFNAPILYQSISLSTFRKARVTVSSEWNTLYDQGGLILVLPQPDSNSKKWVKMGIEFFNNKPHVGIVASDRWADWSLLPIEGSSATIEIARKSGTDGKLSSTLWVYLIEGAERKALREIAWVFENADAKGADVQECWVGLYAAKPTKKEARPDEALEVFFTHLDVETS